MKMITHQAIGVHLPIGLSARLPERLEEGLAILVIQENGFPPIPSVYDMVNRSFIFNSQLARHDPIFSNSYGYINSHL
jgi:hypothetical protein